ncbi:alpha/beta fold hydrolase [Streptomyces parvus]|uniref:alpha/beta fold hydrolase n=1 Tax=Streptomyces parvus TaxID=66428 RepID=UPI003D709F17
MRATSRMIQVNGARIACSDSGCGDPVLMIAGTGSTGRVWDAYQVPDLHAAGFRTITFTNRGVPPSDECEGGFTLADLAADTVALIEQVAGGPCRVVGTSLGAQVAQEVALARPDLVTQAVFMATRGRTDAMRAAATRAATALYDSGVELPPAYAAAVRALQNLSPHTLRDRHQVEDWLPLFEYAERDGPGVRAQLELGLLPDRLADYRDITVPCLVIAFEDDVVTPPYLGREVADAIPGARFETVPRCGHYGYLEDASAVNKILRDFFRTS